MTHMLHDRYSNIRSNTPSQAAADTGSSEHQIGLIQPFGHPGSTSDEINPGRLVETFPAALIAQLRSLASERAVDLSSILFAAFTAFLARYTGQEVLHIGTFAPATAPEYDHTHEPLDLTDQPSIDMLLQRTSQRIDRQPLNTDSSRADNTLATVTYTYYAADGSQLPNYQRRHLDGLLQVELIDPHCSEQTTCCYQVGRFEAVSIARMHHTFQTMLAGLVADPELPMQHLPLLTPTEQYQLLIEWNATATLYRDTSCVHNLFEEQVRLQPDAPALAIDDSTLSYYELNARSNQLAGYLQQHGVGPQTLVGICVERSLDMVIGILAVLKAGGAYVPLDPTYPAERLRFMVTDTQMPILLTHSTLNTDHWLRYYDQPAPEGAYIPVVVYLDQDWPAIAQQSETNPISMSTVDSLAYVIYTSGSTGKPKGVLLHHRGLVNLLLAQIAAFELTAQSRVLQFASFSFDASVSEIFTTLLAGGTLYLADRDTLISPADLLTLLRNQAITTVTLPPSLLALLPAESLPNLQTVVSAGERCSWEIALRWMAGRRFLNAYGPTEVTIGPTYYHAVARVPGTYTVPIGRPLPNIQLFVLDRHRQPVPVGVPGELYIGGVGLAYGYLNRPELTAERFITWPTVAQTAAQDRLETRRLYKTGDLVRYLPDGNLEFLGRIDHQMKLRGFRVELGEIEAALHQHPAVQDVVVLAREDTPDDPRLVAYLRAQPTQAVELWPSVAEYFVYDHLLYHAMTSDERRNESYRIALRQSAPGNVVLDIGTGGDAILACLAVEAGARKVYAIELLEESYLQAKATIERLGLKEKIILIHGDARKIELPEQIDVCVSEIVGAIGGSEGAREIINDAWRFMKPQGTMIPVRSTTRIAAVNLPDSLLQDPAFTPIAGHYVKQIFEQRGYQFDLRLCLRHVQRSHLRSSVGVIEDLDFKTIEHPEFDRIEQLTITADGRIDGFLVWLNLYTTPNEVIDILDCEHCWLPVYLPAFSPGVVVAKGDRIELQISSRLCDNHLNPDYMVRGQLIQQSGVTISFEYNSFHYKPVYRQSPFYQQLFADNQIQLRPNSTTIADQDLRSHLQQVLPSYMIPSAFVWLETFPVTPNGKIDLRALPVPATGQMPSDSAIELPRTPLEAVIANILATVLGQPQIGINDDFFALGGHSLLAARAITHINAALKRSISLRTLFEAPTVAEFAQAIQSDFSIPSSSIPAELASDVVLDPAIRPETNVPYSHTSTPKKIFLTGATGFLGAFLLNELLQRTDATIYCLVRATDVVQAGQRIQKTLSGYQIWKNKWQQRIVPVVGDLRATQLGLDAQVFQHLAKTIDCIYHAGAQVHYLSSYSTLKDANVHGVVEILKLACQERTKPVHYISTIAVAAMSEQGTSVGEDDDLSACTSPFGYNQSKWVAEGIMRLARMRGLPVTIYRPGRISSQTQTGVLNRDDFFTRLLTGCIQMGLAPALPIVENLIPVDYATAAIFHLSQQPASVNQTFHILNPQSIAWPWVIAETQKLGYQIEQVPYEEWYQALLHSALTDPKHALHTLLTLLSPDQLATGWMDIGTKHVFRMQNTRAGLASAEISCPVIDTAILKHMLTYGVQCGLITEPTQTECVAPFEDALFAA